MFEQIMQINANFLLESIKPLSAILIVSIVYKAIFPSLKEIKFDEMLIYGIKVAVYGFLALYIYWNVYTNDYREINVLTFFTYVLAAIEFTHNFMVSFGAMIGAWLRMLYDSVFGKNIK